MSAGDGIYKKVDGRLVILDYHITSEVRLIVGNSNRLFICICNFGVQTLGHILTFCFSITPHHYYALFNNLAEMSENDSDTRPLLLRVISAKARLRYRRTGLMTDLDDALRICKGLLDLATEPSEQMPVLENMEGLLNEKYRRTGSLPVLDKAILIS